MKIKNNSYRTKRHTIKSWWRCRSIKFTSRRQFESSSHISITIFIFHHCSFRWSRCSTPCHSSFVSRVFHIQLARCHFAFFHSKNCKNSTKWPVQHRAIKSHRNISSSSSSQRLFQLAHEYSKYLGKSFPQLVKKRKKKKHLKVDNSDRFFMAIYSDAFINIRWHLSREFE